jgi:two-component system chemotaxis response regulator CheB
MTERLQYQAVVIGVSAGGLRALEAILPLLGEGFSMPVIVVQHISPDSESFLSHHFDMICPMHVKEAEDKEPLKSGTIYFAPPNYHTMVESDRCLALSTQERVNFSRPSIDVLFETAAETYRETLVGIILTGANSDGAAGLAKVKKCGGLCLVQSLDTAASDIMPRAALAAVEADFVLPLKQIGPFLQSIDQRGT